MRLPSKDFESFASAIPPPGLTCIIKANFLVEINPAVNLAVAFSHRESV